MAGADPALQAVRSIESPSTARRIGSNAPRFKMPSRKCDRGRALHKSLSCVQETSSISSAAVLATHSSLHRVHRARIRRLRPPIRAGDYITLCTTAGYATCRPGGVEACSFGSPHGVTAGFERGVAELRQPATREIGKRWMRQCPIDRFPRQVRELAWKRSGNRRWEHHEEGFEVRGVELAASWHRLRLAPRADGAEYCPGSGTSLNIVFILTDDLDSHSMGYLDGLRGIMANNGTTFQRAYVSDSVCCPSRATTLRGQYPHNHGIRSNVPPAGGHDKFRSTQQGPVHGGDLA